MMRKIAFLILGFTSFTLSTAHAGDVGESKGKVIQIGKFLELNPAIQEIARKRIEARSVCPENLRAVVKLNTGSEAPAVEQEAQMLANLRGSDRTQGVQAFSGINPAPILEVIAKLKTRANPSSTERVQLREWRLLGLKTFGQRMKNVIDGDRFRDSEIQPFVNLLVESLTDLPRGQPNVEAAISTTFSYFSQQFGNFDAKERFHLLAAVLATLEPRETVARDHDGIYLQLFEQWYQLEETGLYKSPLTDKIGNNFVQTGEMPPDSGIPL